MLMHVGTAFDNSTVIWEKDQHFIILLNVSTTMGHIAQKIANGLLVKNKQIIGEKEKPHYVKMIRPPV